MTFSFRHLSRLSLAAGFAFGIATAASAAGDSNDDTNPPPKTQTTKTCTGGKVWDKAKKECVNPKKSSFNDDDLYQFAREFAYAGQYDNAITVLNLARNQNDPRVLNYLGYANRKAGRMPYGPDAEDRPSRQVAWERHLPVDDAGRQRDSRGRVAAEQNRIFRAIRMDEENFVDQDIAVRQDRLLRRKATFRAAEAHEGNKEIIGRIVRRAKEEFGALII